MIYPKLYLSFSKVSEFDELIEFSSNLPRKYGFCFSSEMYESQADRKAARAKQFLEMDDDGNGYITMEEWIEYAIKHIEGKLMMLPKDYLGGTSQVSDMP